MALAFLLPLFAGLVSGYIFKKSTDEIGYLPGAFAIVFFLISLVLAPWEIQLLLLVFVLFITQKLLEKNEDRIKFQDSHSKGNGGIDSSE
jgi:Zn-dependent protease with chaperone function